MKKQLLLILSICLILTNAYCQRSTNVDFNNYLTQEDNYLEDDYLLKQKTYKPTKLAKVQQTIVSENNIPDTKNEIEPKLDLSKTKLNIPERKSTKGDGTFVTEQDSLALVAFYNSTGGNSWVNNTNWLTSPVNSWFGIEVFGGKIISIELRENNLIGNIPLELASILSLEHIDFYKNNLTGSIPPEIGNLTSLYFLDLHYNDLSGNIPSELSNLTSLQYLILSVNKLTGMVPTELGKLTSLNYLWLSFNELTGAMPSEINNLSNLTSFDIRGNSFSELPNLTSTQINSIYFSKNKFTFGDLENTGLDFSTLSPVYYSPQEKIDQPNRTDNGNGTSTLTVTTDGTGNTYQWYNEGVEIIGEISNELILTNGSTGIYYCIVKNPIYPNLELATEDLFFNRTSVNGITQEEYEILVSFYNATGGENWTNNTNWLSEEDVKNWYGISTSGGHVCDIKLNTNNLTGTIIPEIGQLVHLNTIQLYSNKLTGTIPTEVGNLTNLTNLDFDYNQLSGAIPSEIGNLTNLISLFLDNNLLGGVIPVELGNLTNLTVLQLHKNALTGTIPVALGNLTKLERLYLFSNNLTGEIPTELGNISSLFIFSVENNQLVGSVPSTLNNCNALEYLYVNNNLLTQLPDLTATAIKYLKVRENYFTFGDIENTGLDFSTLELASYAPQSKLPEPNLADNGNGTSTLTVTADGTGNTYQWYSMSGILSGEIANTLIVDNTNEGFYYCKVSNPTYPELILETETVGINMTVSNGIAEEEYNALVEFYNSTNGTSWNDNTNWLSDQNVNEWYGITVVDGHVNAINLSDNNLSGTIPTGIGVFSNLVSLNLDHNSITGEIPLEIGNLTNLGELNLWINKLTGNIPTELGNLANLTVLDIGYNQFVGAIPSTLGDLSNLEHIWLNNNQLNGEIPLELGNLSNLQMLGFSTNQFSGEIPRELGSLNNLIYLSLFSNSLTGTIPAEIGDLSNLTKLYLHDNQLTGSIPAELGNLTNLQILYLYTNKLTGSLPIELQNCSNLTNLIASTNQLSGTIPAEIGNISTLQYLSLRNNQLTGIIPKEIGNLPNMYYLSVSNNMLEGDIPSDFVNLTNIQELYLDNNAFSNGIELSSLINLQRLTLNDNNFTFGALENFNIDFLNPNFSYSPQGQLPEPSQTVSGENIILSCTTDGTGNTYRWYKDDEEITGETSNELTILNTDGGVYYCAVYNPNFVELTLTTKVAFINSSGSHGITQTEYDALVSFYNSTNGNSWNDNNNWLSTEDVETWKGVTVEGGHVKTLKFVLNGLTGSIPSDIGDLTYLEKIDIQENEEGITGSIPNEIGNLSNLKHFRLYKNSISGNIPSAIGNLTNLELLDLRYNNIEGAIPSEIGNLTKLGDLNLYSNNLSGNIPTEIGNLTSLFNLTLAFNNLEGELPAEIGNLINLNNLFLHHNNFEGAIPSNFENLDLLSDLELHNNNLNELVDLSTLDNLARIRLDNNNLTFKDFETTNLDFNLLGTNYSPQGTLFMVDKNRYFSEGRTLILDCNTLVTENLICETNQYAIYKDGVLVKNWSNNSEYVIASFANEHTGVYSLQVKNPNYPNLILNSDELTMDINNIPSDISLSNVIITEGNVIGETIGTLSTTDDNGDSHTYTLIAGDGSNDANNSDFTIENNILKAASIFDFETKEDYNIYVQSKDADGLTFAKAFVIEVVNNNEAPTDIDLSENSINENSVIGSVIGQLSTTDVDNGDTFTYTFVSGDGNNDADNASFTIAGNNIKTAVELDYETKNEYHIYIQTEDADSLTFAKDFVIEVINNNETPSDIDLSENSIDENSDIGSIIGQLSTTDVDNGDTFTYTFVSGDGNNDADNASFTIAGNNIKTAVELDYETKDEYHIYIQTEDADGLTFAKAFIIEVVNHNGTPTNIDLSEISIDENSDIGSVIGQLSTTDVDNGDTFTYTFVSGDGNNDADNTSFTIAGNNIKTAVELDYETKDEYHIYIQTEDADGLTFNKAFVISINDINEITGINELNSNEFTLYPNPSNGTFAVEYNSSDYEIKIFDVTGSIIYNQKSDSFKHEIRLNEISSGTYFVTIVDNGVIKTQRLIIQ